MPVWIVALDEVYAGHAVVAPWELMKQVLLAQLLPLSLGVGIGRTSATAATWLKSRLRLVGRGLIAIFMALVLIAYWGVLVRAGASVLLSAAAITAGALAIGHAFGGPDPGTRTAVAISSAVCNPGLALLVAALNGAAPGVKATLLAYVFVSAAAVLPYVAWRRRVAERIEHRGVPSHG